MKTCIRRRRDGSAVIVVLALLAILFAYISFNVLTLQRLSRDVKAVERRQLLRLQAPGLSTNAMRLTNGMATPQSLPVSR
jgi:hypothetical protein